MLIPNTQIQTAGVVAILFDSTLGADTPSIDTGANGIAGGYNVLEVWIIAKSDQAGTDLAMNVTVNDDVGNNYDQQWIQGANVTASASKAAAAAQWTLEMKGAATTYPGINFMTIPGYAQTTFNKAGTVHGGTPDTTATTMFTLQNVIGWRNTAAITRMKIAAPAGNLRAGSRLLIYGR